MSRPFPIFSSPAHLPPPCPPPPPQRLAAQLRAGGLDALKRFDEFQTAVQGQGLNVDLDRIRALIETDDFDAALTLLEEMIRKERLS